MLNITNRCLCSNACWLMHHPAPLCHLLLLMQLRSIDFSGSPVNGTIPGDWTSLPKLTTINLSRTALSGPLPLSLVVPSDDHAASATRLTIDITGLLQAQPPVCAPFNLSNPLTPLPHDIIAHGTPATPPLCEGYVSWRITLPAGAACALAPLCGADAVAPTLAQRAQRGSSGNTTIAQLACSAACGADGSTEEAEYSRVDPLQQPRYYSTAASAASGVAIPAHHATRRLRAIATPLASGRGLSRRLLRTRGGAVGQPARTILQAAVESGEEPPRVEMATLGLPATPAAAGELLSSLFSDVLTPQQIAAAVSTTANSSSFEVAPVAPLPAPAPAPSAPPPVTAPTPVAAPVPAASTGAGSRRVSAPEPTDAAAIAGAVGSVGTGTAAADDVDTGGVTAVDASAPEEPKDDDALPAPIIAILVVTACVVVLVVGITAWRSQSCTCDQDLFSVASSKPADFLAAGFGSSGSRRAPSDPRYGDLEPESEEDRLGYPQLSASMSFSNLREVVSDAGPGVRRPMWMSVDASGSLRNLLGRSQGSTRAGSGWESRSPAGGSGSGAVASGSNKMPGSSVSGRLNDKGRFFAEFGKGSPAKALLQGTGSAALLPSPRVDGKSSSQDNSSSRKVRLSLLPCTHSGCCPCVCRQASVVT